MTKLLTCALLAFGGLAGGRVSADACSGTAFASDTERAWVQRVTAHTTNLTCAETRSIYRNFPGWRDEIPGSVVAAAGVTVSPAVRGTVTCTVWTTEKYRAPVVPFGDHVLWSVKMTQSWGWDGTQVVWTGAPLVFVDTTANGFRWNTGGAPWGQSWWVPSFARLQHHTDRNQPMQSWAIHPSIGGVSAVAYLWNWKQFDGDWASTNDTGAAGCRD